MISDEEVRAAFQEMLDYPDVLTALHRLNSRQNKNYRLDSRVNLQIQRGQEPHLWEGAPKGGCSQCATVFCDFDVIPEYCFDCYKIMIELNSVVELFKLLMVFDTIELVRDNTRKCMVDPRPNTSTKFKGFIYCRTLAQANEMLPAVRETVLSQISRNISVKVKRGCTEYAQKYPKYAEISEDRENFKYRKNWSFYEEFADKYWVIEDNIDFDITQNNKDPMRELFALQYWLRTAAGLGDKSYLVLTGGKKLQKLPA
ncbi:hypothetical protein MNBD_GAMMA11-822 [hydrothermal vent metagenome]|uniref:Uncharacterized protein n=1 Tax=hydrothermal vent metagenome TaxID=652676 RepID=A0A3B0XNK2_9ZZZZ